MKEESKVLYFCSTTHALIHLIMLSIPIIALFIQEERDLSYTMIMLFIFISGIAYGFGSIPAGYIADKKGSLNAIILGLVIALLGLLALSVVEDLLFMGVGLVIVGIGCSFYHPSGLNLVSIIFQKNRGRAMGVHGFIGTFGQIPSFIIAALVSLYLNWHLVFLLWGCLVLIMLFLSLRLRKYAYYVEKREPVTVGYKSALKTMLSMAIIMVLMLTIFRGLYYRGTITILPFYARDVGGYSKLVASILATIVLIAAAPGHLFGGWLTDKTDAKKPLVLFTALSLVSILLLMSPSFVLFIAGICLFGFSFFSAQPSLNTLIANITTERIRGVFYGITFATRFGLSYIAPLTLGVVADLYSLEYAFYVILVFIIATLITTICIWLFLKEEQIESSA